MKQLTDEERKELAQPRLRTMPHALFKGLTLSSTQYLHSHELADKRLAKRRTRDLKSAGFVAEAEPVGWGPKGTVEGASERLLDFVKSYTHGLGRSPLLLPKPPDSQLRRNGFYQARYGREIGTVPYSMARRSQLPVPQRCSDTLEPEGQGEDMFDANRQKSLAETQRQIDQFRAAAEAEAARYRAKEEQLQREKRERKERCRRELLAFEESKAAWQEQGALKQAQLNRDASQYLMDQDQVRLRELQANDSMKKLKRNVGNIHSHAVWFEHVQRHKFYQGEEKFMQKIANDEIREARLRVDPNDELALED